MGTISIYDEKDRPSLSRWFMYWLVFFLCTKNCLVLKRVFREEGPKVDWTLYRVALLGNSKRDGGMTEAGWIGDGKWRIFVERRDWANWMVQEVEREQAQWVKRRCLLFSALKSSSEELNALLTFFSPSISHVLRFLPISTFLPTLFLLGSSSLLSAASHCR
ncbi:hypothetical protein VTO42DRAFT_8481 [Malbranchea cinnamomea]